LIRKISAYLNYGLYFIDEHQTDKWYSLNYFGDKTMRSILILIALFLSLSSSNYAQDFGIASVEDSKNVLPIWQHVKVMN